MSSHGTVTNHCMQVGHPPAASPDSCRRAGPTIGRQSEVIPSGITEHDPAGTIRKIVPMPLVVVLCTTTPVWVTHSATTRGCAHQGTALVYVCVLVTHTSCAPQRVARSATQGVGCPPRDIPSSQVRAMLTMFSMVIWPSDPGLLNPGTMGWDGPRPPIPRKPPRLWPACPPALWGPLGPTWGRLSAARGGARPGGPLGARRRPGDARERAGAGGPVQGRTRGVTPGQRGLWSQVLGVSATALLPSDACSSWMARPNPGAFTRRPLTACVGIPCRRPGSVLARQ